MISKGVLNIYCRVTYCLYPAFYALNTFTTTVKDAFQKQNNLYKT